MNWLAFWASVIGSVAWPLAVVIVVLIFRKQLLKVAPWLRELEVGNVKLKFAEGLEKATTAAEQLPQPATPPVTDRDAILAEHAPVALVIEQWVNIEHAVIESARRHDYSARIPDARRAIDYLRELGVITPGTAEALHYLRRLRNEAAHHKQFTIDAEQALEYARLAKRMIEALEDRPPAIPGLTPAGRPAATAPPP